MREIESAKYLYTNRVCILNLIKFNTILQNIWHSSDIVTPQLKTNQIWNIHTLEVEVVTQYK